MPAPALHGLGISRVGRRFSSEHVGARRVLALAAVGRDSSLSQLAPPLVGTVISKRSVRVLERRWCVIGRHGWGKAEHRSAVAYMALLR
jgi:hypothetical protein